jgi:AAA15 family ATPase/GTPase
MKPKLSLSSFCLKNFKAVQDSKTIRFTPLTVFIGNNGSGKSSIVEANGNVSISQKSAREKREPIL